MEPIRLIVSDIDGTLVDKTEMIAPELIRAVKKCREAGIVFALATGRTGLLLRSLRLMPPALQETEPTLSMGTNA